jgi:hypothetical protein
VRYVGEQCGNLPKIDSDSVLAVHQLEETGAQAPVFFRLDPPTLDGRAKFHDVENFFAS